MFTTKAVPLVVEFIGTFLLVLAIVMSNSNPIVVGLMVAFVMWFGVGKSGAHINPAVSLVKFLGGKLTSRDLAGYVVSQCAGAITSLYVIKMFA